MKNNTQYTIDSHVKQCNSVVTVYGTCIVSGPGCSLFSFHHRVAGMCKPGKHESDWSSWRYDHITGKSIESIIVKSRRAWLASALSVVVRSAMPLNGSEYAICAYGTDNVGIG